MPKRGIDYCFDIMQYLKSEGFEKQAPGKEINKAILIRAGTLPAVRQRYFELLRTFGFISDAGNGIFDLHYDEVEKLLL